MISPARFLLLATALFGLSSPGCRKADPEESTAKDRTIRSNFIHPRDLSEGADGLMRHADEESPYTGPAVIRDQDWNLRYFAYYQNGKLHGPELKFWEDGTLRRNFDYEAGSKVRHREWFPNGNPKNDATMIDGVALGPHRTWFEDGAERWSGSFVDNLQWDGPVIDYNEDREIMWDAIFDRGAYVSGVYPESEQEKLIKAGLLKPENAIYPLNASDPESDN